MLRQSASCTVPYQINKHQLLWTEFLIPISHSLVACFSLSFCQHLTLPVAEFNSPVLGAFRAREWFPGKAHLLCCIHLLRQKLSEEELESLSQSALCCLTLCELNHDFSNNSLKIFLWHCLACIIHLSITKESQHSTGLLLLGLFWSSFFNTCPDFMWQQSAKAIELFPKAANRGLITVITHKQLVLKDSACSGGLPV